MTELTPDQKELRNQVIDLLRIHKQLKPSEMAELTRCNPSDLVAVLNNLTELSAVKKEQPRRLV